MQQIALKFSTGILSRYKLFIPHLFLQDTLKTDSIALKASAFVSWINSILFLAI